MIRLNMRVSIKAGRLPVLSLEKLTFALRFVHAHSGLYFRLALRANSESNRRARVLTDVDTNLHVDI